jgi:DNA-binding transcriptional LysR family regulator
MSVSDVSGLELTHLRYFVVLAEELHFGRAAGRLHISQPPLTQQIQRLEARVGHALLQRTSRRVELTAAGRVFHDAARAVLQEAQHALDTARRVGRGEAGHLTLATPPSLMLDTLPRVIRRFRDQFPTVDLRLREMATSRIFDALESGGADVGLVRGPQTPESLPKLVSWKEPLVAMLPPGHTLTRARSFELKRMAAEPFVFFPRDLGPGFYEELLGHCRAAGFEPRVVQEATQWSSVVSLVSAGIGVSIGPASVARLLVGAVDVRFLPHRSTQVHLLSASARENPAVRHFVTIARELFRAHEPAARQTRAPSVRNGPS